MGTIADVLATLEFFGLSPKLVGPAIVVGIIAWLVITNKFDKALNPIKNAIVEIQSILANAGNSIKYLLTETSKSPVKPTEYGVKLVKESSLKNILDTRRAKFIRELKEKLDKHRPFTDYDIQEQARMLLVDYKDNKIMIPVKNYAFQNGISVEIILRTGGLILRDMFLEEKKK